MSERNVTEVSVMRAAQLHVGVESWTQDGFRVDLRRVSVNALRRAGAAFRLGNDRDAEAMQAVLDRVGDRTQTRDVRVRSNRDTFRVLDPVPRELTGMLYSQAPARLG